jgi:hypothetical protein
MSCLFESLACFVGSTADGLRNEICDFLQTDPVLYDDVRVSHLLDDAETPSDLRRYVHEMRKPTTWGSALEIECFCRLYRCRVDVNVAKTGAVARFGAGRMKPFIVLWDGAHYSC